MQIYESAMAKIYQHYSSHAFTGLRRTDFAHSDGRGRLNHVELSKSNPTKIRQHKGSSQRYTNREFASVSNATEHGMNFRQFLRFLRSVQMFPSLVNRAQAVNSFYHAKSWCGVSRRILLSTARKLSSLSHDLWSVETESDTEQSPLQEQIIADQWLKNASKVMIHRGNIEMNIRKSVSDCDQATSSKCIARENMVQTASLSFYEFLHALALISISSLGSPMVLQVLCLNRGYQISQNQQHKDKVRQAEILSKMSPLERQLLISVLQRDNIDEAELHLVDVIADILIDSVKRLYKDNFGIIMVPDHNRHISIEYKSNKSSILHKDRRKTRYYWWRLWAFDELVKRRLLRSTAHVNDHIKTVDDYLRSTSPHLEPLDSPERKHLLGINGRNSTCPNSKSHQQDSQLQENHGNALVDRMERIEVDSVQRLTSPPFEMKHPEHWQKRESRKEFESYEKVSECASSDRDCCDQIILQNDMEHVRGNPIGELVQAQEEHNRWRNGLDCHHTDILSRLGYDLGEFDHFGSPPISIHRPKRLHHVASLDDLSSKGLAQTPSNPSTAGPLSGCIPNVATFHFQPQISAMDSLNQNFDLPKGLLESTNSTKPMFDSLEIMDQHESWSVLSEENHTLLEQNQKCVEHSQKLERFSFVDPIDNAKMLLASWESP